MYKIKRTILVMLMCFAGSASAGQLETIRDAYQHGDFTTALALARPLAEQGYASAQTTVGTLYYNGQGVKQDYAEAQRWYRMAADQGFAPAERHLGDVYAQGQGVALDSAEAETWYRKAADQKFRPGESRLGDLYAHSRDAKQSLPTAAQWYRMAADQGFAPAQSRMGELYATGKGVAQDFAEAGKWYRKAADQGFASAQSALGSMYIAGEGVPQDYVQAYMWLTNAESLLRSPLDGELKEAATKKRDSILSLMTPAQIAEAQRLSAKWNADFMAPQSGLSQSNADSFYIREDFAWNKTGIPFERELVLSESAAPVSSALPDQDASTDKQSIYDQFKQTFLGRLLTAMMQGKGSTYVAIGAFLAAMLLLREQLMSAFSLRYYGKMLMKKALKRRHIRLLPACIAEIVDLAIGRIVADDAVWQKEVLMAESYSGTPFHLQTKREKMESVIVFYADLIDKYADSRLSGKTDGGVVEILEKYGFKPFGY